MKQVDVNSIHSENGNGSGRGSSSRSNVICHNYGKKGHLRKDLRSKITYSSENPSMKYTNEISEWITKNSVVSDTKHLATTTMNHNNTSTSVAPFKIMVMVHGDFT